MLHHLKYRVIPPALPPRRIMLEIPGWSGDDQPRAGGSVQQPWHCTPFVEGATYGLELIYPFPNPCYVQKVDGEITILGDFGPDPQTGVAWPPIGVFNKQFYGFNTYTDVKAPPGFALRVGTHPRFSTDNTASVPVAVSAHLRSEWWPFVFFIIFKAPEPGQTHVFRYGEPYAQIVVVPASAEHQVVAMTEEEAAERELQSLRIAETRHKLGKSWIAGNGELGGDGIYRHLRQLTKEVPSQK